MKAPENNTNNTRKDFITDDVAIEIQRPRRLESGNIAFNLKICGITIYGCIFTWSANRECWFVSFPSRKGNDGKYYNYAFVPFTDADNKKIEDAVEKALQ